VPAIVGAHIRRAGELPGTERESNLLMSRKPVLVAVAFVSLTACGDDRRPTSGDGGLRLDTGLFRDAAVRADGSSGGDAGFGYCPGTVPTALDCRADSDCECGDCVVGSICGATGCAAQCGADTDCDTGMVCIGGCCPYCAPACTSTSCAEGQRCNEANGRCERIPCDEGGPACPVNTRCTADPAGTAGGSCVPLSCTIDGDCDCGACIDGRCWDRPGQCCPPLPG
jgi:hypothetical protein